MDIAKGAAQCVRDQTIQNQQKLLNYGLHARICAEMSVHGRFPFLENLSNLKVNVAKRYLAYQVHRSVGLRIILHCLVFLNECRDFVVHLCNTVTTAQN